MHDKNLKYAVLIEKLSSKIINDFSGSVFLNAAFIKIRIAISNAVGQFKVMIIRRSKLTVNIQTRNIIINGDKYINPKRT